MAIAVTQVVFFPLAFAGGLMLPPDLFSPGLNTFSLFLPTRAARDISVAVFSGQPLGRGCAAVPAGLDADLGTLAVWANRQGPGTPVPLGGGRPSSGAGKDQMDWM